MRIAYVANYQGPTLVARRPVVRNLSMSNRVKMELIATLLHQQSHDVEIISPGEPGEARLKLFEAFRETDQFDPAVRVEYASALPVRRVTAAWSSLSTLQLLRRRNNDKPFDLVIIFNMRWPQVAVATYAMRTLRIPVVLEYEDDTFISVHEERWSPLNGAYRSACLRLLSNVNGCIGVSPYLLSQLPPTIPQLLLRGVVGPDIVEAEGRSRGQKKNWVLFAGTHIESNGVGALIDAWKQMNLPGWELHITGHGHLTPTLKAAAAGVPSIVFHGLVQRSELVTLLTSAKICINPHKVSEQPGIVFAFKIIEYLAAGAHVVTTPMGQLEAALESGVTYLPDNSPGTISSMLTQVVTQHLYSRTAADVAQGTFGGAAVGKALNRLMVDSVAEFRHRHESVPA
jgi:glycosyltransferase involved in cell wall biosynthesis